MVTQELTKLYRYRDLLWLWTMRHIRVRYKQSFLGAAWAVLQPLSLTLVFSVVFTVIVQVPTDGVPYPVFVYTALLPWTFLASSVSLAVGSIVQDMNLVTKIYFPREILPTAIVLAGLADLAIGTLILFIMLVLYSMPIGPKIILLPALVVIQTLLVAGLALIVSSLNVFYRDFRFLVPLGIQLWLYATPIIYPLSLVPERLQPLYMLNPMAGLIEAYRAILLTDEWPDPRYLLSAAVIAIVLLVGGYWFFKRVEGVFADII